MAKTTTKKTVAKKTTKPATVKTTKKTVSAPVAEKFPCGCEKNCACAGKCGCKKGKFFKKLIVFFIIFALGFAAAKMCGCKYNKMPRPQFDNGCLVVKNPEMMKKIPMMDADKDGCVTKEEFKSSKKMLKQNQKKRTRRAPRTAQPEAPAPVPAEVPAPVVAE
ncbi:MAG: hypothetical protein IKW67_01885 [Alphaproteobacteria bacterium]|nr:hypothetical protein [Alphaproteobacteria bacterium]